MQTVQHTASNIEPTPLRRLAAAIGRRSVHDFLSFGRERGLSIEQLNIMQALYFRGELAISELGRFSSGGRSAMSQLADSLVRAGLALRAEAEDDRRKKYLSLTEKGRALTEEGIARRTGWTAGLEEKLGPAETELAAKLAGYIEALEG